MSEELWEKEAELAYSKSDELEKAAEWCRRNGPHRLEFLNQMRKILLAEEIHFARNGLDEAIRTGAVKRTPVLIQLTPSQALRMWECWKRATLDDPRVWRAKGPEAIAKLEADIKRDQVIAEIRRLRKQPDQEPEEQNDQDWQ